MTARVMTVFLASLFLTPPAAAGMLADAPDALICGFPATADRSGGDVVFYVDARTDDGTVVYKTLGVKPLQITLSADGVIAAGKIAECDGRTLEDHRAAGRVFDFD